MTQDQFNEIKERLAKWREDRHLTYENQREEFLGNVFEKVSKYFRAKDNLERAVALSDIAILTINSFNSEYVLENIRGCDTYSFSYVLKNISSLSEDLEKYFKEIKEVYDLDIPKKQKSEKIECIETEFNPIFKKHLNNILNNIINIYKDFGFDFYKCMLQTIK